MTTVERISNPVEFQQLASPLLMRDEAKNCLGIGIIYRLINDVGRFPQFYLLAVRNSGQLVGVAWMTPPHALGISDMPLEALQALADASVDWDDQVPGVVGPQPTVGLLRQIYETKQERRVVSAMAQGIYQLDHVKAPRGLPGRMRAATASDRDLLIKWSHAFSVDCGIPTDLAAETATADRAIAYGNRVLWETDDGQIMSMAGFGGTTPNGLRVNAVYTPPAVRGRGYASALVASLSQRLLDEGRKFCFLFTDLSNPTSNSIYQKIGYKPVCESAHFDFAPVRPKD